MKKKLTDKLAQVMSNVKKSAYVCGDSLSPSFSMGVDKIKKDILILKKEELKYDLLLKLPKKIFSIVKN